MYQMQTQSHSPLDLRETTYCLLKGTRATSTRRPAGSGSSDPHRADSMIILSTYRLPNISNQEQPVLIQWADF